VSVADDKVTVETEKPMKALEEGHNEWITGRLPDKPCTCLVTLYGDSICENYVDAAEFIAKPYHCKTAFLCDGEDITDEVLAWIPFPKPYQEDE
jgi:hypothetical protein